MRGQCTCVYFLHPPWGNFAQCYFIFDSWTICDNGLLTCCQLDACDCKHRLCRYLQLLDPWGPGKAPFYLTVLHSSLLCLELVRVLPYSHVRIASKMSSFLRTSYYKGLSCQAVDRLQGDPHPLFTVVVQQWHTNWALIIRMKPQTNQYLKDLN